MGYRFLDHMTDAYIECYGKTEEEAFEFAAKGLVDTMVNINKVEPRTEMQVRASGHDLENLLFNFLEEILLKLLVDKMALSQFKVSIHEKNGNYSLEARVKGEPLDLEKHNYKIEIKGVTYHLMKIEKNQMVKLRFLLDL